MPPVMLKTKLGGEVIPVTILPKVSYQDVLSINEINVTFGTGFCVMVYTVLFIIIYGVPEPFS